MENKADITTTYCYDVVGNLVKIRFPDGRVVNVGQQHSQGEAQPSDDRRQQTEGNEDGSG